MLFRLAKLDCRSVERPCEDERVARRKVLQHDERTQNDPALIAWEVTNCGQDWWTERGLNHRLENGHIVRDFERIVWAIELATLEELAQFIRATGHECMIGYTSDFDEPALTIGGGYWD